MRTLSVRMLLVLALGLVICLPGLAWALPLQPDTLYTDAGTNLYTLNASTGAATLVGGTSGVTLTDIAFDGNKLYGVDFSTLYQVNPTTGALTSLASIPYPTNALGLAAASGTLWAVKYDTGQVYKIDETTYAISTVGTGLGNSWQSAGDLAYDTANGTLYGVVTKDNGASCYLATIDQTTGAAAPFSNPTGFANTYGISFKDGTLYGVDSGGHLFTLDLGTGIGTQVGSNTLTGMYGLATSPVPLPPSVLLLGSGFLGMGLLGWRRKRT